MCYEKHQRHIQHYQQQQQLQQQQQQQQTMSASTTTTTTEAGEIEIITLNNMGVQLIQRNHHDKAIIVLRRAMTMLQDKARDVNNNNSIDDDLSNVFSTDNNNDTNKDNGDDNSCWFAPNQYNPPSRISTFERQNGYVHKQPIHLSDEFFTHQSQEQGGTQQPVLPKPSPHIQCVAILFNLGIAHHLRGLTLNHNYSPITTGRGSFFPLPGDDDLYKSISFYKLCLRVLQHRHNQQTHNTYLSYVIMASLANNLGQIHAGYITTNDDEGSEESYSNNNDMDYIQEDDDDEVLHIKYFEHLLSIQMLLSVYGGNNDRNTQGIQQQQQQLQQQQQQNQTKQEQNEQRQRQINFNSMDGFFYNVSKYVLSTNNNGNSNSNSNNDNGCYDNTAPAA